MYNTIIEQYKQAQTAAFEAYLKVARFEKESLPDIDPYCYAVEVREEYQVSSELKNFCRRLAGAAVRRARHEFAPTSGRLDIDDTSEYEIAGLNIDAALRAGEIPDVDKLWESLSTRYGGNAGVEAGYKQAAERIIRNFGLDRQKDVKRTSSGVTLRKSVYSEASYSSAGRRRIGYHSCSHTADCLDGMVTFAAQAGAQRAAEGMQSINVHNFEYEYREKLVYPELEIVFFKEAWEFKFSHPLAEKLMIFVGQYGAEYLERRAREAR
ncbi:hypothetical protein Q3O97_06035 [Ralstonia pseudosolanacearum]|uniref:hypothetical protein n=1 Tax=Ralstonia pseudosolanacearum TaxID=1310165 RepID=UPI00270ECD19|nr:hypothetical protein [Ralstonia pseudosolanacearum]MDO3615399.1 hypothetical protein [Ralstonia pseudosolanacearum]